MLCDLCLNWSLQARLWSAAKGLIVPGRHQHHRAQKDSRPVGNGNSLCDDCV